MAKQLQTDFESMLVKAEIAEEVRQHLAKVGCLSVTLFSDWVDDAAEIKDLVNASPKKDDKAEIAKLKGVYRRCKASTDRAAKREADGLPNEDIDEALPMDVHRDVISTAATFYTYPRFDARTVCKDTQLARFRREFQAWQPSLFCVSKVQTQQASLRLSAPKKQRLTDQVSVMIGEEREEHVQIDLIVWGEKLSVLGNTWAIVGCYLVTYIENGVSSQVHFCSKYESEFYVLDFTSMMVRLRMRFTDTSVYLYLDACEEAFRSKAIEIVRGTEKVPWGKALLRVLREEAAIWLQFRDILVLKHTPAPNGQRFGNIPALLDGVKGLGKGKDKDKGKQRTPNPPAGPGGKQRVKTVTQSSDGVQVCKRYNDHRGCTTKQCQFAHICDVLLENNAMCGGKHKRKDHDSSRHGKPQTR